MKKFLFFVLILATTGIMQACNSSNGDRSKSGRADTVGLKTGSMKDSTNGLKDTLKH
ncbi:MAG: hypothetical protein ACRYFB_07705 [Janthinobacterium lividum]